MKVEVKPNGLQVVRRNGGPTTPTGLRGWRLALVAIGGLVLGVAIGATSLFFGGFRFTGGQLDDRADMAFHTGFDSGYEKGYDAGYDKGHSKGYSSGYDIGNTDGFADGKEKGMKLGQVTGFEKGLTTGRAQGNFSGWNEGYEDGCVWVFDNLGSSRVWDEYGYWYMDRSQCLAP